jgi:hypothetical protein
MAELFRPFPYPKPIELLGCIICYCARKFYSRIFDPTPIYRGIIPNPLIVFIIG